MELLSVGEGEPLCPSDECERVSVSWAPYAGLAHATLTLFPPIQSRSCNLRLSSMQPQNKVSTSSLMVYSSIDSSIVFFLHRATNNYGMTTGEKEVQPPTLFFTELIHFLVECLVAFFGGHRCSALIQVSYSSTKAIPEPLCHFLSWHTLSVT